MTDPLSRIVPVDPAAEVGRPPANAPAPSPEFQRILERLEQLSQPKPAPAAPDPGELQKALREADDGFADVMELRRRLEAAFRERQS